MLGTCPYYVGFGVNLVYRLGNGVAYIFCRHVIVYEAVAFDFTGFVNPVFVRLLLLGERICIAVARFRVCLR